VRRIVNTALGIGLALVASAAMGAQAVPSSGGYRPSSLWDQILSTVIFSLLGVLLAIAGFKLFDLAIRFDMEKEICEKNNIAVAILASAIVLGTCIIVAVVVLS
jgi:putative membrane protein